MDDFNEKLEEAYNRAKEVDLNPLLDFMDIFKDRVQVSLGLVCPSFLQHQDKIMEIIVLTPFLLTTEDIKNGIATLKRFPSAKTLDFSEYEIFNHRARKMIAHLLQLDVDIDHEEIDRIIGSLNTMRRLSIFRKFIEHHFY